MDHAVEAGTIFLASISSGIEAQGVLIDRARRICSGSNAPSGHGARFLFQLLAG